MKIGFIFTVVVVATAAVASNLLVNHSRDVNLAAGEAVAAVTKPKAPNLHAEIMQDVPALVEAVKSRVNDPQSVVFRDVAAVRPDGYPSGYLFCGYMNARNGFGGYGNFVPFVMAGSTLTLNNAPIFDQFCNHATLVERVDLQ
jgi:hypothetical protein